MHACACLARVHGQVRVAYFVRVLIGMLVITLILIRILVLVLVLILILMRIRSCAYVPVRVRVESFGTYTRTSCTYILLAHVLVYV